MKREEIHERVTQIRRLLEDLWFLDSVQAAPSAIVLAGEVRVPIPDFEVTANGRLIAAGYTDAVIEQAATLKAPWRVMITVPIAKAAEGVPWLNIALFCATVATTTMVSGPLFAVWLMAILLFHEFGHFVFARLHKMDASWPYFIPAPPDLFLMGTLGAVIRLRSPIRDRRGLFDMAVAGPMAGFVIAVVALAIGMSLSSVSNSTARSGWFLGESLIIKLMASIYFPGIGGEQQIILHPIGFAAWGGLLVTMFNLLPIGQLDGGHIAYAMFGRHQKIIARIAIAGLAAASFYWIGWVLWAIIGLLLRPDHPPTLQDEVPIGRNRKILGWLAIIIFALCFTPAPLTMAP